MTNKPMNFIRYIQTYFPWFDLDEQCYEIIKLLNYYLLRDERFEQAIPDHLKYRITYNEGQASEYTACVQSKLRLSKGLLIIGNVGTGKTEIFNIMNSYNKYLQSPYYYRNTKVWKLCDKYREVGDECFNLLKKENFYFDELCLLDADGNPSEESIQRYGNNILIGEKLITVRNEVFKEKGFQSHFSTNATLDKLRAVYRERAFSRLLEMCNVLMLIGKDRRIDSDPVILNNFTQPIFQNHSSSDDDYDRSNREYLDRKLTTYLVTGEEKVFLASDFTLLGSLGVTVASDEEVQTRYLEAAIKQRRSNIIKENGMTRESKTLMKMHDDHHFDNEEQIRIMSIARVMALGNYAAGLKNRNVTSFFLK